MTQDLSHYTADYYRRPELTEMWFVENDLLRPDELACVCYAFGRAFADPRGGEEAARDPGLTYSIGCGPGRLEAHLEGMGVEVVGVDPAPGAAELYEGKTLVPAYEGGGDTVIFCESLEHLPVGEIDRIWSLIPETARIIVANWLAWETIPGDHRWDHITTVDSGLFDRLSEGRRVIVRRGSHLVLDGVL